ncbi:MAG: MBL fold metallo-hydrolase [Acholeplasmatales bacterium]|nr:MBL fold metallo-hydrolase [Acholeplasmatales bacterium]
MKIIVLGSGSKGNSTYIIGSSATIIIDAGISFKQFKKRLNDSGIETINPDALLITHEHGDHTGNMCSLLNKLNVNYYINERSYLSLSPDIYHNIKNLNHTFVSPFEKIKINDMEIEFIPLSHDTVECLGMVIKENDKKVVYIADTGYLDSEYRPILEGANCYLFEANYDPEMEMNSNRCQRLKNRVLGDRGHLSNEDSAVNLSYLITDKTKNIVFIHRSQECNSLDVLKETVFRVFNDFSIDVDKIVFDYAEQDYPSRIIEV